MSACMALPEPEKPTLDIQMLTREMDITKSMVFRASNAAFLGSLMCNLNFHWDEEVQTAATDGVSLWWNPKFFLSLKRETRKMVLMHELWHCARMHMVRRGDRDHQTFNIACDHKINLDLLAEGYSFEGVEDCFKDEKYRGWVEEDIYDDLIKNPPPNPPPPSYVPDIKEPNPGDRPRIIQNVVKAVQQAKMAGQPGTIPGDVEVVLKTFLAPIIPWEQHLNEFMSELVQEDFSWRRPNRRFTDMYLPSRSEDEGMLTHIMYFQDVSGSIEDADNTRFNSEIKYVKDHWNPKELTLVQFDTRITDSVTFSENDPFEEIKIIGRGGTSLKPVREHIIEHMPTAVIIFSDLHCDAMEVLPFEIPILWVCIRNRSASVPFGRLIHIR